MRGRLLASLLLILLFLLLPSSPSLAQLGATVPNWKVPSRSGPHPRGILTTQGDITNPVPFIGVTPCRIVDTRGPAGTFGAPPLTPGMPRNFPLTSGPCAGLPASAEAYSLNITVTNTLGPGFIKIYPEGSAAPGVSTLNYVAGQTIANAAIVPAGTGGGITVAAGVSGTDLIIDINGYFDGTRTRTIRPVGTQAQNGAALLSALAGITTASATNPWLLKLQPGLYDIGSSTLSMKPYVDIEGSGELTTTIMSSGLPIAITVVGSDTTELRFLSLSASSSGSNFAVAYYLQSGKSQLTHVTVTSSDTGAAGAGTGVTVTSGAVLTLDHVAVTGSAPNGQSEGLSCQGATALVRDSSLTASGGSFQSDGILTDTCTLSLQNSIVSAGGAPNNFGILNGGTSTVNIDSSQIIASTNTINNSANVSVFVGASKLSGGPVFGGTSTCAGVYNGSYSFFPSSCP
jgi:hypothetical protein